MGALNASENRLRALPMLLNHSCLWGREATPKVRCIPLNSDSDKCFEQILAGYYAKSECGEQAMLSIAARPP